MKRKTFLLAFLTGLIYLNASGQESPDYIKIDIMLARGEYNKVIDTCKLILSADSMNAGIYYKMGLACQNLLPDDKSAGCFQKASSINPDNKLYKYMVAKGYYAKGKSNQAKPLFQSLYLLDSINWTYAYYLTGIYMQEEKYDESIIIYSRFYKQDSTNYVYMDKLGFAYLQKGDYDKAIDMFNKSLEINPKNINALKNLAWLYSVTTSANTGIKLLTKALAIDSTDLDLFVRRAALNFTIFNYRNALNDYLKLINYGDSSVLNLKRAGIGYANNRQPKESVEYLLKAYEKDTADFEIVSYLAQNYALLNDLKNSACYYNCEIKLLTPAIAQLGVIYILLGGVLKSDNQYNEAISAYLKSQKYRSDNDIIMIIANIYDEKLKDFPNAVRYYEMYLKKELISENKYQTEYNESIRKRVDALRKTNKATN
jgi:tetratricopeptide (TPR) repeat protein